MTSVGKHAIWSPRVPLSMKSGKGNRLSWRRCGHIISSSQSHWNWVESWWFHQFFTFLKARLNLTALDRYLENQLYRFLLSGQDVCILNKWPFIYDFKESKLISFKNSGHSLSISKLEYSYFIKFPPVDLLSSLLWDSGKIICQEKKKKKECYLSYNWSFGIWYLDIQCIPPRFTFIGGYLICILFLKDSTFRYRCLLVSEMAVIKLKCLHLCLAASKLTSGPCS